MQTGRESTVMAWSNTDTQLNVLFQGIMDCPAVCDFGNGQSKTRLKGCLFMLNQVFLPEPCALLSALAAKRLPDDDKET